MNLSIAALPSLSSLRWASQCQFEVLINLRPERSDRVSGPSVSETMLERGGLGRLAARIAGARKSSRWKRGMSNPLSRIATRVAYGASHSAHWVPRRGSAAASTLSASVYYHHEAQSLHLRYGLLPRVAWYVGHSLAMRQLAEEARRRDVGAARRRAHTNAPVPDRRRLYADMAMLLWQDLANVEAGLYPLPADHDGSLLTLIHRFRLFFEDLPEIYRRRESGAASLFKSVASSKASFQSSSQAGSLNGLCPRTYLDQRFG